MRQTYSITLTQKTIKVGHEPFRYIQCEVLSLINTIKIAVVRSQVGLLHRQRLRQGQACSALGRYQLENLAQNIIHFYVAQWPNSHGEGIIRIGTE